MALDRIPPELRSRPQWICWRLVTRTGKKPTKVPINPRTGSEASTKNPSTWATYDDAVQAMVSRGLDGVGYVFAEDDGYFGVDLDNVINDDGTWRADAMDIVGRLNTYTERSVGGRGLHVIGRGSLGDLPGRCDVHNGREIYSHGRYFTMTGDVVNDLSEIRSVNGELPRVYREYWGEPRRKTEHGKWSFGGATGTLDQLDIPDRIKHLIRTGDGLNRYQGDRSSAAYAACLSMCWHGVSAETQCDLLTDPRHFLAFAALERRGGDVDSARSWVLDYCVRPAAAEVADKRAREPVGHMNAGTEPGAPRDADPYAEAPALWPSAIDLAALSTRTPKEPEFIVEDWLPVGYATLFAGHGGVGKSGIALYLAVCNALGLDFFGLRVKARRVLYLSCEDREEVLHWRLSRICAHLEIELSQLSGKLDILDLVGRETILWERDPRTGATETDAARELRARIARDGIEVLYVDGVSDTYGGNENARPEVKRFVNMLVGMVPADRGAVVMIGHVAKPAAHAASTSEGYSGSTGWHNSVRARWYLYPETRAGEDGERSEKTGDLLLELQKSNLGPTDQAIRFEWDTDGRLFVGRGVIGESALDRQNRDRSERRGILAALASAEAAGIYVPAASMGQRTAYHVLSAQPNFPDSLLSGTPGRRRFWRHLEALRAMQDVIEFTYTREDRHKVAAIRSNGAGCGHAGNAN